MWKYIFSNDTPLFPDWNHWVYSAATASVYLAFNGRLCCRQRWKVSEPRGERDKQEANRCNQMNNVCPSLPCYRTGKKELWTMNWRNVWGSLPVPFLPHCTLIHTGLWFVLHCLTLTENSMSPSVFKIMWNKQVHIFALRERGIGITMWTGLMISFEVTLVSKLIKYLMPIIHFNHGRWHLLPELWSIFTTVLLKGHNPRKACFFL